MPLEMGAEETEEAERVTRVRAGDVEQFDLLVGRYQRLVYAIAWARLRDGDLCDDVVQETFLLAWQHLPSLRDPDRFGPWVSALARSAASRLSRTRRRENRVAAEAPADELQGLRDLHEPRSSPSDGVLLAGERTREERLSDALEAIPQKDREALTLFYLQEKRIAECARMLEIGEGAFKMRLHRARQVLRGEMEAAMEEVARRGGRPGLRSAVAAALPAASASAGGKTSAAAGLLGMIPFLGPLMIWGLVGWAGNRLARNYRDRGRGRDGFRGAVLRTNFLILAPMITAFVYLFHRASGALGWSSRENYLAIAAFCLGIALLRILQPFELNAPNRRAQFIAFVGLGLSVGLPALLGGDAKLGFISGMLLFNVVLWKTRKTQPFRCDYSIFLRAAAGTLGERPSVGSGDGDAPPDRKEGNAFSVFLTRNNLVQDRSRRGGALTLYLIPAVADPLRSFLPIPPGWGGASWVRADARGGWGAGISALDRRFIQRMYPGLDMEELAQETAEAAGAAFAAFRRGDSDGALGILQRESDEDVFERPPPTLRSQKIVYGLAIASGILLLVMALLRPAPLIEDRWGQPQPVDEKLARRAVAVYLSEHESGRYGRLVELLEQPLIPETGFYDARTQKRLRTVLQQELLAAPGKDNLAKVTANLRRPAVLYNSLRSGLLTPDEVRALGYTRETIARADREARQRREPPLLPDRAGRFRRAWNEHEHRPFSDEEIRTFAELAWSLAALGCVDLLPLDSCTSSIAVIQYAEPTVADLTDSKFDFGGLFVMSGFKDTAELTWGALTALQAMGRLDAIDRDACERGLRRLARERGKLPPSWFYPTQPGRRQYALYCLADSLRMLGVPPAESGVAESEFETWSTDQSSGRTSDGRTYGHTVAPHSLAAWAYRRELFP